MTGRILIVDAVPTNRIVLRVKLSSAFYDVVQAASGEAALAAIRRMRPDLIIAADSLPDVTVTQFASNLRAHPLGARMPLLVVMGDNDASGRLAALAAGADDVLSRPVDDMILLARLRALLRARDAEAELELREDTRRALGLGEAPAGFAGAARVIAIAPGRAADRGPTLRALRTRLGRPVDFFPIEDALRDTGSTPDVIVLIEGQGDSSEALSLLPQLRASSRSRHAAIIYVAGPKQRAQAVAALDMGASDLVTAGPEPEELALRIRRQALRKQTADRLRANMRDGLRAAVIDPLTGLYNRRYVLPHLDRIAERSERRGRPYALLLADIDHFKKVNDTLGHAAGDTVLVAVAERLRDTVRAADLVSRHGGEEFLVVLPDADRQTVARTAQRLVRTIEAMPVTLDSGMEVSVTISVGAAMAESGAGLMPRDVIETADKALYAAKAGGRNRAILARSASEAGALPENGPDPDLRQASRQ